MMCSGRCTRRDKVDKYAATHRLENAPRNSQYRSERGRVTDRRPYPVPCERAEVFRTREPIEWLTLLHAHLQVVAFVVVRAVAVVAGVRIPAASTAGVQDETFAASRAPYRERQPQVGSILDCDCISILHGTARLPEHRPHIVRQGRGSEAFVVTPQDDFDFFRQRLGVKLLLPQPGLKGFGEVHGSAMRIAKCKAAIPALGTRPRRGPARRRPVTVPPRGATPRNLP
jgi:hypothetical protein